MKRTIGIITLVLNNYGTKLQSYALCKTIEKLGFEPHVINLKTPWGGARVRMKFEKIFSHFNKYGIKAIPHFINRLKWTYENMLYYKNNLTVLEELKKRCSSFETINALIPYTKEKYTYADLRNNKYPRYDEYLVGSDQVWNGIKVGNLDVFMLDFLEGKKGKTYAVSFGMKNIPNCMCDDYLKRISNFESLLVREDDGVKICKKLGRTDAEIVLDPTLLLTEDEYAPIFEDEKVVDGKYILVYSLNKSLKIYNEAHKLAKRYGCKMVMLKRNSCPPTPKNYDESVELFNVSVGGFLWLIKNAECVVTNSYHALLFSIVQKSKFYLFLDNADEKNSRLLTVARLFGLEDRIYWERDCLPITIKSIDYDSVYGILAKKRKESLCLLEKSLMSNN